MIPKPLPRTLVRSGGFFVSGICAWKRQAIDAMIQLTRVQLNLFRLLRDLGMRSWELAE